MIRIEPIKAITIWQPWATLIALRLKGFETRGRRTHYRGPIAIHAGMRIDHEACEQEPIKSVLAANGFTVDNLPTGAVIAIAELTECWEVVGKSHVPVLGTHVLTDSTGSKMFGITQDTNEFHFGDFTPGRFAWEMSNVQQLPQPVPAKGQQGLWNWRESREEGSNLSEKRANY